MSLNMRPGLNGDTVATFLGNAAAINEGTLRLSLRLREAAPHGRNYQHLTPSMADQCLTADLAQWREALAALDTVLAYSQALYEATLPKE